MRLLFHEILKFALCYKSMKSVEISRQNAGQLQVHHQKCLLPILHTITG